MRSFIAAIVVNPFYTRHREYRRVMQYTGLCCTVTAIVLAAFAKSPMAILGSLGLLFPLGGSLQVRRPAGQELGTILTRA